MEGIQFLNDTFYDSLVKKGTIKSSTKAEVCIRISEIFDYVGNISMGFQTCF